jgi:hypothetical protein
VADQLEREAARLAEKWEPGITYIPAMTADLLVALRDAERTGAAREREALLSAIGLEIERATEWGLENRSTPLKRLRGVVLARGEVACG